MSKPQARKPDATIVPAYVNAYNEIVKPKEFVSLSVYFIKHWLPNITPAGLKILMTLRVQGFYNPATGIKRDTTDIDQRFIAEQCGMSLRTLQRTFAADPVLAKYAQREFKQKRDRTGRIIKEHYIYHVVMDDVLTPQDQSRLEVMTEGADKPTRQSDASVNEPMRQNDASDGQDDMPTCQNDASTRQNDASYKGESYTLTTKKTLNTSATPGDSLTLRGEKTPEQSAIYKRGAVQIKAAIEAGKKASAAKKKGGVGE